MHQIPLVWRPDMHFKCGALFINRRLFGEEFSSCLEEQLVSAARTSTRPRDVDLANFPGIFRQKQVTENTLTDSFTIRFESVIAVLDHESIAREGFDRLKEFLTVYDLSFQERPSLAKKKRTALSDYPVVRAGSSLTKFD